MSRKVTTDSINNLINKFNLMLVNDYNGKCGSNQLFQCNSIFKHQFTYTWDNMRQRYKKGCVQCNIKEILNHINIYQYDMNNNYITMYENMNKLQELYNPKDVDLNLDSIKSCIKETRLKSFDNQKWSFIAPIDNKLVRYRDKNEDYTEIEQELLKIFNMDIKEPEVKKGNNRLTDKKDDKRCNKVNPVIKVDLDTKTILAEYSQPSEAIEKELINGFTKDIINKGCNAYKKEKSLVNITKAKKRIVFMYKDNNQLDLS